MNLLRAIDRRWLALGALFAVFSLAAIPTGEPAWLGGLGFLGFLGFLGPGRGRGFLPFVNRCGQRVVRWRRLVLAWICVISAAMFGSCAMAYLLMSDWREGAAIGTALGLFYSLWVTVRGFTVGLEKLPLCRP